MVALHPHTPKHIKGGWSHYTDTTEPVNGYGAQNNYGHCPTRVSNQRPFDRWSNTLTNCANRAHEAVRTKKNEEQQS
jgi:hypothetical protein